MIRLYEHPLSPYAQKVKIALLEKGMPFEAVTPHVFGSDPEWERDNPRREVPTLVDGDVRVFDSTIILQYLEDLSPEPALLPADAAERARVRMLEDICDTYVEAVTWGIFEVRFFKRAEGALADALLARAHQQWAGVHAWLERALGTRRWFNGASFGWGDLAVYPFVAAAAAIGYAPAAGSALDGWLKRAADRDSTRRASAAFRSLSWRLAFAEALTSIPIFKFVPELLRRRGLGREYRDHRLEWMMRSGGADIVRRGMEKKDIRFALELR